MKITQFLSIVGAAIIVSTVLIGLSYEYDTPTLRYIATVVVTPASGFIVAAVVARRRKALRTGAADSFEAQADVAARAAAFRDGLVVVALAGLASVVFPHWPAWLLFAAVLFVLAGDYWIRYGVQMRRIGSIARDDE